MKEIKMKLELGNVPSLQGWLSTVLKPLCDADPLALTKYVLALLKKDLPEETLRSSMIEQLDIFLQEQTIPFVDQLFEQLRTKKYEETTLHTEGNNEKIAITDLECASAIAVETIGERSCPKNPSLKILETCHASNNIEGAEEETKVDCDSTKPSSSEEVDCSVSSGSSEEHDNDRALRKTQLKDSTRENKGSTWRGKRSRSPSMESNKESSKRKTMSYSIGPSRKLNSRNRPGFQRSTTRRRINRNLRGRRRSRSSMKSSSVSPVRRSPRSRRRSNFSRSQSRSRSPVSPNRDMQPVGCTEKKFVPMPDDDSLFDHLTKCSVKSVVIKPDSVPSKKSKETSFGVPRKRCRDFDEKGLCMKGELCQYDHGSDPVVLEDVVMPSGDPTPVVAAGLPIFPNNSSTEKAINYMDSFMPLRPPGATSEYFPESPSMGPPPFSWNPPPRHFRPQHLNFDHVPFPIRGGVSRLPVFRPYGLHGQRHLIPVPVDGNQPPPPFFSGNHQFPGPRLMCRGLFGTRGRGTFDFRRLGTRPMKPNTSCCLVVRKIPQDLNKIETLINHFSKFGNVVSIQINFDGDPEGALVAFNSHYEAVQAYRSADAVLNNRFIKLSWHNGNEENLHCLVSGTQPNKHVGENMYSIRNSSEAVTAPLVSSDEILETLNPNVDERALQQKSGNRLADVDIRVELPENIQFNLGPTPAPLPTSSNVTNNSELQNTKQSMMLLMNEHIEEQKKIIAKLEANRDRMTPKQKEEMLNIVKSLQKSCQELRKNIGDLDAKSIVVPNNGNSNVFSKEEVMRKILDAELELYSRERNGQATVDVEKQILKWRAEAVNVML